MSNDICKSKVIIFDFDGVIVDSEKVYHEKWKEAAIFNGYNLSKEQLLSLRSCDSSIACNLFGGIDNYKLVRAKRRELMNKFLDEHPFELKPGIKDTFNWLNENGYTIIIASSSELDMIYRHLELYNLRDYIYEVLSVKSLKRGKPYPDIYIEICKHYNLNPADTLAVEDSPNGVASAYGANVKVVMIPDLTEPDDSLKKKISFVLNKPNDIIELLK